MKPLLSIVVPVYNRASLVVRTLDSIAASKRGDFHLIVVDNGSADGSLAACERWAAAHRDDVFTVEVTQELRAGAPAARNTGLARVTTPFVYFFDSDDLFSPTFTEAVIPTLATTEADLLFVPVNQVEANGTSHVRSYMEKASPAVHILSSMLSTQSMVFRTEWLRSMGAWNEQITIWQDWELGTRALLAHPRMAWLTDEAYHAVMIHPESISGQSMAHTWAQSVHTMECALRDVMELTSSQDEKQNAVRALYLRARILMGLIGRKQFHEGVETYSQFLTQRVSRQPMFVRLLGRVLQTYTRMGGRGAWRMALYAVK